MIYKLLRVSSVLLIPGYIEYMLAEMENTGNMGLHGVYLELYLYRTLIYLTPIIFGICGYMGYPIIGLLISLFCIGAFLFLCGKWLPFL